MDRILVLDFGGQYNQLIARRVREQHVYAEIKPYNKITVDEIRTEGYAGIIFTGGPNSVYDKSSPHYDPAVLDLSIPILGICLGHQLIAKTFGGEVSTSDTESYAQVKIDFLDNSSLFKGLESPLEVWSSHKDEVHTLPEEFDIIASSSLCDIEAMKHKEKEIYGIQFHPEVHHTPKGEFIFKNFYEICQNYKK